jgi:PAS domain S-box-containing protein
MISAAVICVFIVVFVWFYRRKNSETIPLILLLLGVTEWVAAALLGLVDQNLSHNLLWAKIEYIGVVSVPVALLGYILHHTGLYHKLNLKQRVWLAVIPVITLVLAWTNGKHGLIWSEYIPYLDNGLVLSKKIYGPGFWVYWVYSYLVLLTATFITFRSTFRSAIIFRWQSVVIIIAILVPWIGNLLYVLQINPFNNLDLTPLSFSITGILIAIGMFRWRLIDIKPIAHEAVFSGMADGLIILDNYERIVDVNSSAQDILDLKLGKLVGRQFEQIIANLLPLGEESYQMRGNTIEMKLTSGKENQIYELSDSPYYEKQATLGGRIIFLHDVTDRKRLEQHLILRTAELESANKELEAFSYSVSHDLLAPLRGIDGWSLALLEEYGSQLDEQAKTYLERVRSETQHMNLLINDLLKLSRLTRTEMKLENINLSAIAQTIAKNLLEAEPDRQVEFEIQPELQANGDGRLLQIALTNLLDNAFKFTGKIPQALIQFGETEVEGERAFFVRDNGAGFDMAYVNKLFVAFQRLHKKSAYPGTGIGLTTVSRIVHRHGGRIWTEAAVNEGATFYFTLAESL